MLMHRAETAERVSHMPMTVCLVFALLLWATCGAAVRDAQAQSLEEKLGTVTNYLPKAVAPVEQLVEVAQRFKTPMGIEWIERSGTPRSDKNLPSKIRSVRELIEEIVKSSPEQQVEVDDGLVRIYSPIEATHRFNFLNIRLKNYSVSDGDLFAAQDQLRWAIRFALEPEKYRGGYGGGYGHGANDVFEITKFTVSASDVTIREVLDRIAMAQGNALWVATIKSADLNGDEPCWNRDGVDGGDLPVISAWHFFPLSEIEELAKEHVAVDVMVPGILDQRMTTIPVMLESGLAGNAGGSFGGSSSEGISYNYAASIEKIGKDFVTLSVQFRVGRKGEPDFNFEKKIQVQKDRVTELQPESRIRIRAYIEPSEKP
jgi:hypothetical protein